MNAVGDETRYSIFSQSSKCVGNRTHEILKVYATKAGRSLCVFTTTSRRRAEEWIHIQKRIDAGLEPYGDYEQERIDHLEKYARELVR